MRPLASQTRCGHQLFYSLLQIISMLAFLNPFFLSTYPSHIIISECLFKFIFTIFSIISQLLVTSYSLLAYFLNIISSSNTLHMLHKVPIRPHFANPGE